MVLIANWTHLIPVANWTECFLLPSGLSFNTCTTKTNHVCRCVVDCHVKLYNSCIHVCCRDLCMWITVDQMWWNEPSWIIQIRCDFGHECKLSKRTILCSNTMQSWNKVMIHVETNEIWFQIYRCFNKKIERWWWYIYIFSHDFQHSHR